MRTFKDLFGWMASKRNEAEVTVVTAEVVADRPGRTPLKPYLQQGYYVMDMKLTCTGEIVLPIGQASSLKTTLCAAQQKIPASDVADLAFAVAQKFDMQPATYFRDKQTGDFMSPKDKTLQLDAGKSYQLVLIPEDVTWRPKLPVDFSKKPTYKYRVANQK